MSTEQLAIIFLVDGARPDVMRDLLQEGRLPHLADIAANGTFREAISCCPSTTGPAYMPFLTGCFPGTVNIPGIRWLDKAAYFEKKRLLSRIRSYNGIEAPLFNSDIAEGHPTIYELFERPFNIFSMITRGLPKDHNIGNRAKPFAYLYAHITDDWKRVDSLAFKYLMDTFNQNPDFIFAVFPGVDSYSHLNHPAHDKTLAAYEYVDFAIGQTVEKLKKQGRWDETLLIVTSDHGLTATHTHLDLAHFLQRRKIKTLYYPIIWKRNSLASVMISGNALGHIYWLDGNGTVPSVKRRELHEFACRELLAREEIDILFWREDGKIVIDSARGRATIISDKNGMRYLPETGDPLGLGSLEKPLDSREALLATIESAYPDALVQISQLFSSPRSGDLVAISKSGYDLRQAYEWPEHHSSHGSLCREHMTVPLIYNQTGWDKRPARTADIFNTILDWAGKPIPPNTDGDSLII